MTTLVPGQRQIPNKLSFPVTKSMVNRENDISQNNAQGGNSPALRVPVSASTHSPGDWSTCKCFYTFPRRLERATDRERGKHTAKETTNHWGSTQAVVGYRYPQQRGVTEQDWPHPSRAPLLHTSIWVLPARAGNGRQGGVMVNRHSQDETKPGGPQDQAAVLTSLLHSNSSWPHLGTSCLAQ